MTIPPSTDGGLAVTIGNDRGSVLQYHKVAATGANRGASSTHRIDRLAMRTVVIGIVLLLFGLAVPDSRAAAVVADPALPSTIVDADWLAANLQAPDLVVVDARPADYYELGHVEGAVNLTFPPRPFPPAITTVRDYLSTAGIGNRSRVVIYDDGSFTAAARTFWIMEVFGHDRVAILNVGFGRWPEGRLPVSMTPARRLPATFVPSVNERRLATKLSTRLAIDDPRRLIIDARSREEYEGKHSLASRAGHIPSSVSYPWDNNYVVADGAATMRSLADLTALYKDLDKSKAIIAHCNGGAQAALNYVALRAMGYDIAVYGGSWLEWGNDPNMPIINPAAAK